MRSRLLSASVLALVLALVVAGAALAGNGGLGPTDPVSPNASRISGAYWLVAIFAGIVFVLVEGALIVFVVRFRRRGRPRTAEGPQIHGSTRLELLWTVVPVLILAFIGGFVFYKLPGIKNVPASASEQRIRVEGRQFYWEFRYPNGVVTVDRLRVPVDEVVRLDVTAPEWDVIHSWWIPRLGGKIDAIPGRVNHTWLKARKVGVFRGQCAELCGLFHAKMLGWVEVMPRADYDKWVTAQQAAQQSASADFGKEIFGGVCAKCHNLTGPKLYGPTIGGNALLADESGLMKLLHDGRGRMPPVGRDWPEEQLKALFAYTKTQAGGTSGG